MDGHNGYEQVELSCQAFGGRPIPEIKWYIDNHDNDDLDDDSHFDISTGPIGSDYGKWIENYQSSIKFQIDSTLLDKLSR